MSVDGHLNVREIIRLDLRGCSKLKQLSIAKIFIHLNFGSAIDDDDDDDDDVY